MFYLFLIIGLVIIAIELFFNQKFLLNFRKTKYSNNKNNNNQYSKKKLMTNSELYFYNLLKNFANEYEIMPQVNLATVIEKKSNMKYQTELYRNIDFGIFTKYYQELLLLIEINDPTHNSYKRKERDKKVKIICESADVKLITFYTNYPNKPDYVLNRIKTELDNIKQVKLNIQNDKQLVQAHSNNQDNHYNSKEENNNNNNNNI